MLYDTSGETAMMGAADYEGLNGDENHRSFLRGGNGNGSYQNMLLQQVQHQSNEKKSNRKRRAKINGVPVAYGKQNQLLSRELPGCAFSCKSRLLYG